MQKLSKEELDRWIINTNQKANKIKHIDKLVNQLPEGRTKKVYKAELMEMLDQYRIQCDILEVMTDDYIKQVQEDTGEIPLIYVKLSKALKEE